MKKSTKTLAAAALAISALTPVAAASAASSIADGVYTSTNYYSIPDFKKLSTADKAAALTSPGAVVVVGGTAYTGADVLSASDSELPDLGTAADAYTTEAGNKLVSGQKIDAVTGSIEVSSVSAINKTKVEVTFNKAIDAAAKENFTIAGAQVNGAEISEDKKSVILEVSGLKSSTEYTVVATGLKVAGETVADLTKTFTTKAVTDLYTLKVTPAKQSVVANGQDNVVIKFELLDIAGAVDTSADNMVLEISSTFGNLANSRVTIQDGVGQVVLASEFANSELDAKVTAQIIEASADYKELIGKVAGEATVNFTPTANGETDPNAVTFLDAESNQADRVTLYFDKEVSPATFMKTKSNGEFETTTTTNDTVQVAKSNVDIKVIQDGVEKEIVGMRSVEGNSKAVEVILSKSTTLKDNALVTVNAKIGNTQNEKSFTLTDARKPEFTGVSPEGLTKLNLKFSESVDTGNFSINGLWSAGTEFEVIYGEFDAKKGIDYRDTATAKLLRDGVTNQQLYFPAGNHSITVTQLKDFAATSDSANISTTQTLNFAIAADPTAPTATVSVESPEQFRVTFKNDINVLANDVTTLFNDAFEVYNETTSAWEKVSTFAAFNGPEGPVVLTVDEDDNEFVVELASDWTKLMTDPKDAYYNYQYRFNFAADVFENATNGVKSAAINLNLSYVNSPLTEADNVSPLIQNITANENNDTLFTVLMSEPVKLTNGTTSLDRNETLAIGQSSLQEVKVEFQGKDKNGKAVVIPAAIVGTYTNNADNEFVVSTSGDTLQVLVDSGYNENWKLVVRSISDDIGNTAATLTKDFVVEASETTQNEFQIVSPENGLASGVIAHNSTSASTPDSIEIEFTKGVSLAGIHNLTSVNNWTLNGRLLSNLSNVASIKVVDVDGDPKNGYEKVVITFSDERAFGASSNVISVTKGILSSDGTVLTGENEVVAETITTP